MKWIVSSTATPSAMLAAIIEPISTGKPNQPMPPKITRIGRMLGNMAIAPAEILRDTNIINGRDRDERPKTALNQAVQQGALALYTIGTTPV